MALHWEAYYTICWHETPVDKEKAIAICLPLQSKVNSGQNLFIHLKCCFPFAHNQCLTRIAMGYEKSWPDISALSTPFSWKPRGSARGCPNNQRKFHSLVSHSPMTHYNAGFWDEALSEGWRPSSRPLCMSTEGQFIVTFHIKANSNDGNLIL